MKPCYFSHLIIIKNTISKNYFHKIQLQYGEEGNVLHKFSSCASQQEALSKVVWFD